MSHSSFVRPLRLLVLAAAALAVLPATGRAQSSSDEQAIAAYRLTMPAMRKAGQATERMLELLLHDDGLAKELETLAREEGEGEEQGIADIVAAYDKVPRLKGAITGTGLSVREFVVMQLAMMQAALVVGFQDPENTGREITIPEGVSKENVAFVRTNWDELQRMSARTQALQKELEARAKEASGESAGDEPLEEAPAEEPSSR